MHDNTCTLSNIDTMCIYIYRERDTGMIILVVKSKPCCWLMPYGESSSTERFRCVNYPKSPRQISEIPYLWAFNFVGEFQTSERPPYC